MNVSNSPGRYLILNLVTVNEENKYAVIYTTNKTLYINKGNYASYL